MSEQPLQAESVELSPEEKKLWEAIQDPNNGGRYCQFFGPGEVSLDGSFNLDEMRLLVTMLERGVGGATLFT